jgi:hypothetical protein
MRNKPVLGLTDNKITVSDLTLLMLYYQDIWNTPAGSFTFATHNDAAGPSHDSTNNGYNDPNNLNRRVGWGQGGVALVDSNDQIRTLTKNDLITVTDLNQVIAQINAGFHHTEADPNTANLIPFVANTDQKIPIAIYEAVITDIFNFIDNNSNKYKLEPQHANLSPAEETSTNTTNWSEDLYVVHKFEFNNYNEARYFFNAGGELTLTLDMAAGGTTGNQVWQQIFEQFDSIRIGAEKCRVVNDDGQAWNVASTSAVNGGFYTGLLYSASSPDFNTILDAGVFAYVTSDVATVYLHSEYNSRRIRLQLKGEESGSKFNLYVKVILVEDVDDTYDITQDITLESGYVQPGTIPVSFGPNVSYMTVDGFIFQFRERTAPIITEDTAWTSYNFTSGTQLEDWSGTWLTNVRPGYFVTGQDYTIKSINNGQTPPGADTDFTLIGAADNNIGTVFTATGPGTGTGSADEVQDATDDPGVIWELDTSDDYTGTNRYIKTTNVPAPPPPTPEADYTWSITAPASVIGGSSGTDDDIVVTSPNSTATATFDLLVKYTLDSNTVVQAYRATRTLASNSNTYDLAIPYFRDYAGSKITQATIEVWDDPTIVDADTTNPRATSTVNIIDGTQTISLASVPTDQVNEGDTFTVQVTTEYIPTGTVLNYAFSPTGEINGVDTGTGTVAVTSGGSGNIPNIVVVPTADATTEGDETLTLTVSSADNSSITASTSVIVDDTSRGYETWTFDEYLNQVYGPNGGNVTGYNSSTHITALENLRVGMMGTATPTDLGKSPEDVWLEFLRATFADPTYQVGLSTSDQTYIATLNGYIVAYNNYALSVPLVDAYDYLVRRPTTGTTYDDIGYKWAIANASTTFTANQIIYNVLDDNPNDIP